MECIVFPFSSFLCNPLVTKGHPHLLPKGYLQSITKAITGVSSLTGSDPHPSLGHRTATWSPSGRRLRLHSWPAQSQNLDYLSLNYKELDSDPKALVSSLRKGVFCELVRSWLTKPDSPNPHTEGLSWALTTLGVPATCPSCLSSWSGFLAYSRDWIVQSESAYSHRPVVAPTQCSLLFLDSESLQLPKCFVFFLKK